MMVIAREGINVIARGPLVSIQNPAVELDILKLRAHFVKKVPQ